MPVIFLPTHTHRSLSAKEPYNCITHYTPSIKEPYAHTALWWWQRFRVVSQRKIHTHTPLSFRKRALQIHRQSALGVHRSLSAKDFWTNQLEVAAGVGHLSAKEPYAFTPLFSQKSPSNTPHSFRKRALHAAYRLEAATGAIVGGPSLSSLATRLGGSAGGTSQKSVLQSLQHTASWRNTLQHNTTRCNTVQQSLQHAATRCNTLQHGATRLGSSAGRHSQTSALQSIDIKSFCVCALLYVCLYVCMYVCIYVCMYIYMYECKCICIYVYIYTCICVYVYVCIYIYIYVCVCIYIYIYVFICAYTCTWSYIYMYIRI